MLEAHWLERGVTARATTTGAGVMIGAGAGLGCRPVGRCVGRLVVGGWARNSDADLSVTIYIDGEARTPVFSRRRERADVCTVIPTLGDCATAGYEVAFDFETGDAGRHDILAVFRAPDGRVRRYQPRSFVWKKD